MNRNKVICEVSSVDTLRIIAKRVPASAAALKKANGGLDDLKIPKSELKYR